MGRIWLIPALFAIVALSIPSGPVAAATSEGERHCVVEVVAQTAQGELLTGPADCYSTFAEAMSVASDGRLRLPAANSSSVVFSDQGVAAALASFTRGIHYDGASGSGSSISAVPPFG